MLNTMEWLTMKWQERFRTTLTTDTEAVIISYGKGWTEFIDYSLLCATTSFGDLMRVEGWKHLADLHVGEDERESESGEYEQTRDE